MFEKISLYFYTLKYLKVTQVYYRIIYTIVNRFNLKQIRVPLINIKSIKIIIVETVVPPVSYLGNSEYDYF